MRQVFVIAAVRTPIGRLGGVLSPLSAVELGRVVVEEALGRAAVQPTDVDEVVIGQVLQAGAGANPARQVSLLAGLPTSVPAFTVNKLCASGMKAITLAASAISSGEADIVVAGGMESMSRAPYLLDEARGGYRLGDGALVDSILRDALVDPLGHYHMAITAETLAADLGISRLQQDSFAAESHRAALASAREGRFAEEIVPLPVPQHRGDPVECSTDESPRADTTPEALARLKPAFKDGGSVTAGNASGVNDGAAALVLASGRAVARHHLEPLATVVSWCSTGLAPELMGLGPVSATRRALDLAGLSLRDMDVFEVNEAFAVQVLAVMQELGLARERVNRNGGAIALGHPVGASGARILVTLLGVMRGERLKTGLATLCVGGGQGMATILRLV